MRAFFLWTAALVASTVDAFVAPRAGSTLAATTTTTRLGAAHKPTAIDRVLYHHSLHLEDQEWDTIFIGSGIGSLAAAALLAQSGQHHKVLVLEQHDRIGGCCHTFQQRGYSFGTGIHYVGEVGLPEKDDESPTNSATGLCLGALLAAVTPLGAPIAWSPLPENYDTIVLGGDQNNAMTARTYHIYANDRNQTKLKAQFPNPADQAAIDAYTAQCRAAQQAVARSVVFKRLPRRLVQFLRKTRLVRFLDKGYTKWARQSVAQVVDGLTANADLKAVLCYNWGDYGSLPSDTPFCMHSLLQGHYQAGGFYPTGGPDKIPQSILPVITAAGGKAFARAPVQRIITDDHHRAVGVAMADGSVIKAKHAVVSDAGVMNTIHSLVPDDEREALLQKFQLTSPPQADPPSPSKASLQNSMTGLTLFVGLKGDHDVDFHLPHDQLWLYPSAAIEEDLRSLPPTLQGAQDVAPQDLMMFIGSPSGKDSAWKTNHPQRTTLEIITAAPWEWFEAMAPHETSSSVEGATDLGGKPGSHGKEYAVVKQVLANKMWTRARQALTEQGATGLPEDLADVGTYCLGTPLTYAHFLQSRQGAFYGLNHDRERFAPRMFWENLRPEVPEMDHLYLTGQDIATCGLTGALMGAYLCASKILGVTNPFRLLDEVEHNRVVAGSASPSMATDKAMPTTVGVAM